MPFAVRISTLYIGQGLCNVIEVHKGDSAFSLPEIRENKPTFATGAKLEFLGIVDMGTIDSFGQQAGSTVYHIECAASFIRELLIAKKDAMTIDYLSISHLDEDHYNGLGRLIKSFGKGTNIPINKLVIGGESMVQGLPDAQNISTEFLFWKYLDYSGYIVQEPTKSPPAYYFPSTDPYIKVPEDSPHEPHIHHDVALDDNCVLRLNVLMRKISLSPDLPSEKYTRLKTSSIFINAGSTILLASLLKKDTGGASTVYLSSLFPGDATRETFRCFLRMHIDMETHTYYKFKDELKYLVIPHHGSLHTIAFDHDKHDESAKMDVLEAFLKNYTPDTAVVSAHDLFNHPHVDVLRTTISNLRKSTKSPPTHTVRGFDGAHYVDYPSRDELFGTYFIASTKYCQNYHLVCHSHHSEAGREPIERRYVGYPYTAGT